MALTLLGSSKAQETQVIGKSNIKLSSKLMTPEEQEPPSALHDESRW